MLTTLRKERNGDRGRRLAAEAFRKRKRRHEMAVQARDQLRNFPHCGNVGGDVEDIGDEQQHHDALEHDPRERGLDLRGKSFSGNPPDEPAHGLDRGHQWKGERHRPQHVEAELRARLGIGGYTAWIVVGNTGNKSWPQPRQGVRLTSTVSEHESGEGNTQALSKGIRSARNSRRGTSHSMKTPQIASPASPSLQLPQRLTG